MRENEKDEDKPFNLFWIISIGSVMGYNNILISISRSRDWRLRNSLGLLTGKFRNHFLGRQISMSPDIVGE